MTITSRTNTGAALGSAVVVVVVAVLAALLKFFSSGAAWPSDIAGWLQILLPALVAGALSALTPYYVRQPQAATQSATAELKAERSVTTKA